ncbi:nicotinate-nucleotide adenylyltransferase [Paenactinomyces guangxiensis]|uniref:Probable nicotinate-nucleotide adenylyltransferase n=1 Tax=Paenactinomyces guangxiensis TaxID=1490290 RepID=A0A7W1WNI7_9BACL|nr:nicotinate-nucleotide adenylyltransferase [Paenactinomyces guangxiensis]MBA4493076.1 nicotinate-nucleotide adenylyltransferase [Paenactinomyces guangxiensis]MBH8590074.1 nicotinate-nucleotide adenylyltransferase [Paenactinomyces guangxiensis]
MKVGIFGGTFDPIHMGHLLLAQQALEEVPLDHVWFIPASEPPHKQDKQITPSDHRVRMVELAIENNPAFCLSRIELDRQGPSYTVDTVQELAETYPNHQFFLLVGADMVKDLPHWYKIKKILQFVQVIALGRPGVDLEPLAADIAASVTWISGGIETNLSSTLIRHRVAQGKTVRYLVPDSVCQYMKEHGLYGT